MIDEKVTFKTDITRLRVQGKSLEILHLFVCRFLISNIQKSA